MSVASAVAFGLSAGAAVQAFRQVPPDSGPLSSASAWLVVLVAAAAGYLWGRRRGRGGGAVASAVAVAEAVATNQNHVQLAVVVPGASGAGAASADAAGLGGSETLPWLRGPSAAGSLEGVDLDDVLESHAEAVEVER